MNREVVEKFRVRNGFWKSETGDSHGLFFVQYKNNKAPLKVLSSPFDEEWQHVSVSLPDRCPTWEEMAHIKKLFWGEDVTVVQFHPKKSEYVNNHPFCLHLWRKKDEEIELPPSGLVGVK